MVAGSGAGRGGSALAGTGPVSSRIAAQPTTAASLRTAHRMRASSLPARAATTGSLASEGRRIVGGRRGGACGGRRHRCDDRGVPGGPAEELRSPVGVVVGSAVGVPAVGGQGPGSGGGAGPGEVFEDLLGGGGVVDPGP